VKNDFILDFIIDLIIESNRMLCQMLGRITFFIFGSFIVSTLIGCTDSNPTFTSVIPKKEVSNKIENNYCKIIEENNQTLLICPDGSQADISKGNSCSVSAVDEGAVIYCEDGTTTLVYHGQDGADGSDGVDGTDGKDGIDGQDGANGAPAPLQPFDVVDIIDPCADSPLDEVLLKFANGKILAHFASGTNQHFTLLNPGNYITTDGTQCRFSITESGDVVDI
jgi:hypothetical protein